MSIIFDALKKAQIKLTGNQKKDNSPKAKDAQTSDEPRVAGFKIGEDLTQPLSPIPGAKPIEKKVTAGEKKDAIKPSIGNWVIYDVRSMNPFMFLLMVFFGLLGVALVFYIFSYKLKDKFIVKVSPKQEVASSKAKGQTKINPASPKKNEIPAPPIEKNIFHLSSEVSLSLDGIVSTEGRNLALIDNQVVQVGDTIKGAVVVSISPNEVILSFQGKEITLTMK